MRVQGLTVRELLDAQPERWRLCAYCRRLFHPRLFRVTPDSPPTVRRHGSTFCSIQCERDLGRVRNRRHVRAFRARRR